MTNELCAGIIIGSALMTAIKLLRDLIDELKEIKKYAYMEKTDWKPEIFKNGETPKVDPSAEIPRPCSFPGIADVHAAGANPDGGDAR